MRTAHTLCYYVVVPLPPYLPPQNHHLAASIRNAIRTTSLLSNNNIPPYASVAYYSNWGRRIVRFPLVIPSPLRTKAFSRFIIVSQSYFYNLSAQYVVLTTVYCSVHCCCTFRPLWVFYNIIIIAVATESTSTRSTSRVVCSMNNVRSI